MNYALFNFADNKLFKKDQLCLPVCQKCNKVSLTIFRAYFRVHFMNYNFIENFSLAKTSLFRIFPFLSHFPGHHNAYFESLSPIYSLYKRPNLLTFRMCVTFNNCTDPTFPVELWIVVLESSLTFKNEVVHLNLMKGLLMLSRSVEPPSQCPRSCPSHLQISKRPVSIRSTLTQSEKHKRAKRESSPLFRHRRNQINAISSKVWLIQLLVQS